MTFRPADPEENSVTAELDAEGRYSATLPAGEVTVIIDNREFEPRPSCRNASGHAYVAEARAKFAEGTPRPPPRRTRGPKSAKTFGEKWWYLPIPQKYYELETSGLKFTIKDGDQPLRSN